MEHILDEYERPYDPDEPRVCVAALTDETTKQLTREVIEPLSPTPGTPERYDTLYQRNGVAVLFMFFEPLVGWRGVRVTEGKTRVDWAHQIKRLLDVHYPRAKRKCTW